MAISERVTVFGAGAWGTTLTQVLTDAGNEVLLWARNQSVVDEINSQKSNLKYLGDIKLPKTLRATSNLDEAFTHSDIYILAIPTRSEEHT